MSRLLSSVTESLLTLLHGPYQTRKLQTGRVGALMVGADVKVNPQCVKEQAALG